ncbi:hypothetical protein [Sporosarcina sp. HYO08]
MIYKKNGIYYSEMDPYTLLNRACIRYASTIEGKCQNTRF